MREISARSAWSRRSRTSTRALTTTKASEAAIEMTIGTGTPWFTAPGRHRPRWATTGSRASSGHANSPSAPTAEPARITMAAVIDQAARRGDVLRHTRLLNPTRTALSTNGK